MRFVSRVTIVVLLVAISSTAYSQFGDAFRRARDQLREARDEIKSEITETGQDIAGLVSEAPELGISPETSAEQAGRLAQDCDEKAASNPAFRACAGVCTQVAGALNPQTPEETGAAMLRLCTDSHAQASAQSGAPALPAQAQASAPATQSSQTVNEATPASAGAGPIPTNASAIASEMLSLAAACDAFAENPRRGYREICLTTCEEAAQNATMTGINIAAAEPAFRSCREMHAYAARIDRGLASGLLGLTVEFRDECAALPDQRGTGCARVCERIADSMDGTVPVPRGNHQAFQNCAEWHFRSTKVLSL